MPIQRKYYHLGQLEYWNISGQIRPQPNIILLGKMHFQSVFDVLYI